MSAVPWVAGGFGVAALAIALVFAWRKIAGITGSLGKARETLAEVRAELATRTDERDHALVTAKDYAERIEAQEEIRHDAAARAQRIVIDRDREIGRLNDVIRDHTKVCPAAGDLAGDLLDRVLSAVPEADHATDRRSGDRRGAGTAMPDGAAAAGADDPTRPT